MAEASSIYLYKPSHALPAVFSALIGVSLLYHVYQNFRYKLWRVTWFMVWGGLVFTSGWVVRVFSSYHPASINLYIAQNVLILAGPPIYSAAEYNILGRLMRYLPMHAPLHPDRVVYFFLYLGSAVESLTAAGASLWATSSAKDLDSYTTGGVLISTALVLQAAVECLFIYMVVMVQRRASRTGMFAPNIRRLCLMLYGTSALVLFRCIFRAIESFGAYSSLQCNSLCRFVLLHEWYLYAFEAAPMLLYTFWINVNHPGHCLPSDRNRYLDYDGKTERIGPGWVDRRNKVETFIDPFDLEGRRKRHPSHDSYWLRPDEWPAAPGISFAARSAENGK